MSSATLPGQNLSERIVFAYLVNRFQASASELALQTGMPGSTVAGIMSRLVSRGLVSVEQASAGRRGRPVLTYRMRLPRPVYACLFGGTQIAGASFDTGMSITAMHVGKIEKVESIDQAAACVKTLLEGLDVPHGTNRAPRELALALNAVSMGSRVWASSVLPWASDDVETRFSEALGLTVRTVSASGVLSEYQNLRHPVPQSFIHFRIGDGVSSHAVINGQIYEGASSHAGELGHVVLEPGGALCGCGRRGCLEAYCSGPAIHLQVVEGLQSGVASVLNSVDIAAMSHRDSIEQIALAWQKA